MAGPEACALSPSLFLPIAIGGGTAQILRTVAASRLLNRKLPQTRDGYSHLGHNQKPIEPPRHAAE